MKRALISDIHGNLEALLAVLVDIRQQGIAEIYCLGDVVGYGPNPAECLDLVMAQCQCSILGCHDEAVLFDPLFRRHLSIFAAIEATRRQLDAAGDATAVKRRNDFLLGLPRGHVDGDSLYVHGSPREPTHEYVFPEDVFNPKKMAALFQRVEQNCFLGHSHYPGVFTCQHQFLSPCETDYAYQLDGKKTIVNIGSVGQPRDRDPRACYVVFDGDLVIFRRVEYDSEVTRRKLGGG